MKTSYTPAEREALQKATEALHAIGLAIAAYKAAGFGSLVTDPLHDALDRVMDSIREVQS